MAKKGKNFYKHPVTSIPKRDKTLPRHAGWTSMTTWLMALVAVLPFLFSQQTLDPALTIRHLFLSGFMLSFVWFFYLHQKTIFDFYFPPLVNAVFAAAISYSVWSMVTFCFAINPSIALYEIARFLLNIILLFSVILTIKHEALQVLKLCRILVIVSIIQSMAGILQYYEVAFTGIPGTDKPYGFMVHRTLFGSAQVLLLPFVLFVLYKGAKAWKYTGAAAFTGIILSIAVAQSRSAWLAAIAVILTAFMLIMIFSPQNRRRWIMATLAEILAIVGVVSALLVSDHEGSFSLSIRKRVFSLFQTTSDYNATSTGRLTLWSKSLHLLKQHMILGVGPGNWHLAIPVYTSENSAWSYGQQVPSWPHNVYLQVACETGIPGAILYFCLFMLIITAALRVIFTSKSEYLRVLNILMLSGLAAFATDGMFSFPTERIEHTLYLTLMAGIILGSYIRLTTLEKENVLPVKQWFFIVILFIAAVNIIVGYQRYNFEKHMKLAIYYRQQHDFTEVLNEAEKGKSKLATLDPTGEPIEIQSSAAYVELKDYGKALAEIRTALSYHPNSGRIWTTMGVVYADMQQYEQAIRCYNQALRFIPHYDIVLKNLAGVYFITGDYSACIKTIERISFNNQSSLKALSDEAQKRLHGQ